MMGNVDIAIVGAGFSGSALAIHLHRHLPATARVALIDEARAVGRGLAYGTTNPAHLLNVMARSMSLFPDQPDDFVDWLECRHARTGERIDREVLMRTFAPRCWYGDYVRERLAPVLVSNGRGPAITIVPQHAVRLQPSDVGWRITLTDGSALGAGAVVLCTGNLSSTTPLPAQTDRGAIASRLIDDPWTDPRMSQITSDATVLMVGTGLTMVDQVLRRETSRHTGPSIAVSRRGLLPTEHLPNPVPPSEPDSLVAQCSLDTISVALPRTTPDGNWRQIVDGLRPITQSLWMRSSLAERRRFLRHLAPYWGVLRHRMAPWASARIERAREAKRLEVLAGRITHIEPERSGRIAVTVRGRATRCDLHRNVDWIVNCSGPERDVRRAGNPFLRSICESGIARVDALHLGLDTTPCNAVIAQSGAAWTSLFAIGPLTMGRLWEIVAVPDLRVQCATMAEQLAAR